MFKKLILAGTLILFGWLGLGVAAASGASAPTANSPTYNCATATGILPADCQALVALHTATNGAGWTNSTGWLATTTPCTWYGVTCDSVSSQVVDLVLSSNQLSGTLPVELGNLTGLQTLYLDSNQLSGPIPSQLGNLTALLTLDLSRQPTDRVQSPRNWAIWPICNYSN